MDTQEAEKRAAYTSGLRKLADIIDTNPDMPLIQHLFGYAPYVKGEAVLALAGFARALPKVDKVPDEIDFTLEAHLDGLKISYRASRSLVCEKREVTKTVEEWVCPDSLLEYAAAVDAA